MEPKVAIEEFETEAELKQQAYELEHLLPAVMRHTFTLDPTHPLSEMPFGQFRLCTLLFREGKRTMSQVSEDLSISVSAVTQMADRLEKAGMVERVSDCGGDRRTRFLQLTDHGKTLMETRQERRITRATAILRLLSEDERREILSALDKLRAVGRTVAPIVPMPYEGDGTG